jgi:P27 family predicted phage terminase small subunit
MPRTVRKDSNLNPGDPVKPSHLSAQASREWDRLTGELKKARVHVTAAHGAALILATTIAADIAASWKVIEEDGLYWTNSKTGEPKEHPAAKGLDALRREYLKALTMLGPRASVAKPKQQESKTLEEIINGDYRGFCPLGAAAFFERASTGSVTRLRGIGGQKTF